MTSPDQPDRHDQDTDDALDRAIAAARKREPAPPPGVSVTVERWE